MWRSEGNNIDSHINVTRVAIVVIGSIKRKMQENFIRLELYYNIGIAFCKSETNFSKKKRCKSSKPDIIVFVGIGKCAYAVYIFLVVSRAVSKQSMCRML